MCGTLAHAAVEGLGATDVPHERVDIEVQGLVALGASQSPADEGGNIAIAHVSAAGYAAVVGQNLAKAAVVPLQLLQPCQGARPVDAAEGIRPVPLGEEAQTQQRKAGGCYVGIGRVTGDIRLGVGVEPAREAVGQDVVWRAAKAAMGMLVAEDPSAQTGAVVVGDEGRGRRRGQEVEGGEDEEAERQADAVVARVVVGEARAEAALPVADVAGCVERRIGEGRRRHRRRHGGDVMSVAVEVEVGRGVRGSNLSRHRGSIWDKVNLGRERRGNGVVCGDKDKKTRRQEDKKSEVMLC